MLESILVQLVLINLLLLFGLSKWIRSPVSRHLLEVVGVKRNFLMLAAHKSLTKHLVMLLQLVQLVLVLNILELLLQFSSSIG